MIKNNYGKWEVPKNYTISYDRNKDYNEVNSLSGEYLPPYRSDFRSIYDGIGIEMHIVDHCNLNCKGCAHFSNICNNNMLDIDKYSKDLDKISRHFNVYYFRLLGGEPLLHPKLKEIVKTISFLLDLMDMCLN